jgi:hypothetical protein
MILTKLVSVAEQMVVQLDHQQETVNRLETIKDLDWMAPMPARSLTPSSRGSLPVNRQLRQNLERTEQEPQDAMDIAMNPTEWYPKVPPARSRSGETLFAIEYRR